MKPSPETRSWNAWRAGRGRRSVAAACRPRSWQPSAPLAAAATGGRCLDAGEAGLLLARDVGVSLGPGDEFKGPAPNRLELVEVDVAHDGRSNFDGESGATVRATDKRATGQRGVPSTQPPMPRLRCLRLRDRAAWPREAAYFGPKCRAEQDGGEGWTYG